MFEFIKSLFGNKVDYKQLIANGAIIVDVRTPAEFDAGHIATAKNIPLDKVSTKVQELKKLNKPIITCCKSGARSGMAKILLSKAGIEVYNGGSWDGLQSKL